MCPPQHGHASSVASGHSVGQADEPDCRPLTARILGYTPEELEGRPAATFIDSADLARAKATFAAHLCEPGSVRRIEFRVRHRDGSWRMTETIATNRLHDPACAVSSSPVATSPTASAPRRRCAPGAARRPDWPPEPRPATRSPRARAARRGSRWDPTGAACTRPGWLQARQRHARARRRRSTPTRGGRPVARHAAGGRYGGSSGRGRV